MNVHFKVYWNNPIDMVTEAGTQQLTFEVPLGAVILDIGDISNYYTKAETDAVAASKVQQTITHGVTTSAPSQDAVSDALLLKQNLPTGYVQGWQLSIDPLDNTKFTIAAGGGIFTDFTDVFNIKPTIRETTAPITGITPQFLATHPSSYIAFDINLNIVQSSSPFTNEDRRTLVLLGNVVHSNNLNINVVNEIKAPIIAPTNQLHDYISALGGLNIEGNEITPNGNNLSLNRSAGTLWKLGINASDYYDPHRLHTVTQNAFSFAYRLRNSTQYISTPFLDPTNYDLNGVRTTLTNNNRWSIQRLYLFQSGVVVALYGQAEYSSYQNALNALLTEPFETEKNCKENGFFIGRIILKKTCTDLVADMAAGIASIHLVDKFGASLSTASVTYNAVINALGYTPAPTRKTVNPQSVSYQLQLSDANNIVRTTGASVTNITVPNAATVAWTPQDKVEVEWYGVGQPTIVAGSGVTIRVAGGGSLTYSNRYEIGVLEYIGADEWILHKDDLGGATSTTWVDISTLTGYTKNANVAVSGTTIEVAKFGGLLWIRGFITTSNSISINTELFGWSDTNYLWDYVPRNSTFTYSTFLNRCSIFVDSVDFQMRITQNWTGTGNHRLRFFANQAYGEAIAKGVIPPTPIGKHL